MSKHGTGAVSVKKIKEIIRLRALGLSQREIACAGRPSRSISIGLIAPKSTSNRRRRSMKTSFSDGSAGTAQATSGGARSCRTSAFSRNSPSRTSHYDCFGKSTFERIRTAAATAPTARSTLHGASGTSSRCACRTRQGTKPSWTTPERIRI